MDRVLISLRLQLFIISLWCLAASSSSSFSQIVFACVACVQSGRRPAGQHPLLLVESTSRQREAAVNIWLNKSNWIRWPRGRDARRRRRRAWLSSAATLWAAWMYVCRVASVSAACAPRRPPNSSRRCCIPAGSPPNYPRNEHECGWEPRRASLIHRWLPLMRISCLSPSLCIAGWGRNKRIPEESTDFCPLWKNNKIFAFLNVLIC